MTIPKPLVLCILDGWGHTTTPEANAIQQADTPNWDRYWATCPKSLLQASALDVGLPTGQMGNSEVGHMNIGAGRVVMQELPRIDQAVADGSLAQQPRLVEFIAKLKHSNGACHLMGLLSPGGVHAHQSHIAALAKIIASQGVPVIIHAFLDGRDTPPKSAQLYLEQFLIDIRHPAAAERNAGSTLAAPMDPASSLHYAQDDIIKVGTVSGRYYAMDRDNRWDRVEKAYHALVTAQGERAATPTDAIKHAYAQNLTDEFILPTVIDGYTGIAPADGLLMANFRADRARQLLHALLDPAFDKFATSGPVPLAATLGMVEYSTALNAFILPIFESDSLTDGLGETVAKAGRTQLRIAETEKYAHVTFFFNGGSEVEYPGEQRILVPSPKVATYDLQPEMSAPEVTDKLVAAIESQAFDLIVVNYANGDMVGHSGDIEAAKKAVVAVDTCIGRLETALNQVGGAMLVTADHGNAEQMTDPHTLQPHTAHTVNPVPFVLISNRPDLQHVTLENGILADIAPTVLTLMQLPIPAAMTGQPLIAGVTRKQANG